MEALRCLSRIDLRSKAARGHAERFFRIDVVGPAQRDDVEQDLAQ